MSYQPPFDGNWLTQNAWLTQNEKPPPSVTFAVRFIYAGAAIQAVTVILEIGAVRSSVQNALATASATPLTASQLNTAETVSVIILVLGGLVGASLWLWMARKNRAGRRWARILSTVAFAFLTVSLVAIITQPVAAGSKIIPLAEWVVGFLAIVLLWRSESSDFYRSRSRRF